MWCALMLLASLHAGTPTPDARVVGTPAVASDSTFTHSPPAALTADATSVHASGASPRSWSSHFALDRDGIFVRVALDGSDVGWFLLDTGANTTVIDTSVARERHLAVIGSDSVQGTAGVVPATVYELGNVSVNGALMIAATGIAQDLRGFPSPDGKPLSGVLGSDFLGAFAVHVDFATREVTFSSVAPDATACGCTRIHFAVDHGAPRIPVTLDGVVAAEFRIDTGLHGADDQAAYLAVTDDVWHGVLHALKGKITVGEVSVRGLGAADVVLPKVRIDGLTIGSARVSSPWVVPQLRRGYFADRDAVSLLGNGVLERFSPITIDYLTGTLYLTVPR